jgi:two-component system nitrogen regulation response regulator NtrX
LLIVDEDRALRAQVGRLLERHQYDVRLASGPDEALRMILRGPPTLIVTELQNANDEGDQLLQDLERSFPSILRIVYSAKPQFQLDMVVRSGHAHAALQKGVELCDLVALVHGLLTASMRAWTC